MSIGRTIRHAAGEVLRLSTAPFAVGPHITRYQMYERLGAIGRGLEPRVPHALSISHSTHLFGVLGLVPSRVTEANYPDVNCLCLPHEDESFDLVVSDQVLEHIAGSPQQAIDQSLRVLKKGGLAVHTTCFVFPKHGSPADYWRFTPEALRLLCAGFSDVIAAEGWGNPLVWPFSALGLAHLPVPRSDWHPINRLATYNHPAWPVCTWVVARK